MKYLTKALLNLASFAKLTPESKLNKKSADEAINQLIVDLSGADVSEIRYLKGCIQQEIVELGDDRTPEQQERIEFLLDLIESINS